MNQAELLRYIVEKLEGIGIDYMVSGSHASIYYGEPRMTHDIDVVAEVTLTHLPALLDRFASPEFYLSEEAARDAILTRGQFNIIHSPTGLKVDIVVRKDTPYHRVEFARRWRQPLLPGVEAYFARPEDVILNKLLYFQEGGSERHLRDITGMLRVSGPEIDTRYIDEWAQRLGVGDVWRAVLQRTETR
ncbi:MAG: nucleotidyl transferase AbiEii/AbiGii toxin family protein [Candidatus Rokubacteria bacterium]|nr:nucleotidyl transferase AbiEii/AbiGii toxin family protein [Candidatus Rokubacteria bacterium]